MEKGRIFVFFGPSGCGKDYIMKSYIEYCNRINVPIVECKRYFTRVPRIDEKNDDLHQYNLPENVVCNDNNISVKINGEYLGISLEDIEKNITQGENIIIVSGSVDLINKLLDSQYQNDIILTYITIPGLSLEYYLKLEESRNPEFDIKTRWGNAKTRLDQSEIVTNFYNQNQSIFDYAYLNITKNAIPQVVRQYNYAFFATFFEELLKS